MNRHPLFRLVLASFTLLAIHARLAAQTDGLFADFKTSLGSFTCRLDHAIAPKAVANFVGLATGQRAWLDLPTGVAKTTPYFDGLMFHRVIKGFMNQSGSPNGQGTDGPGYAFQDEFNAAARHDAPGVLSMANSGPNSNGSQFFVTAVATPWLNDLHTVFGRVVSGLEVVTAINEVKTGAGDKPLTNVVIQSVSIRRVGAAAQAFDIHAQGLPVVTNLPVQIAAAGTNVNVSFANRLYADNHLHGSTNLTQWTDHKLGIEIAAPVNNVTSRAAANSAEFFHLAQVQYASSTHAPKDVLGRVLTLNLVSAQSASLGTLTITFGATSGGTYTYSLGTPGTITNYSWSQEPYTGRLWPVEYSGLIPMTIRLSFKDATSGTLSGTGYPTGNPFNFTGTFTLGP